MSHSRHREAGQLALLDSAVPLPPDPGGEHSRHFVQDTSLAAYDRYVAYVATEREVLILAYLDGRRWHGAIDDEGWRDLGLPTPNSYAPCRTGLKKRGLVVWRGVARLTSAGNRAKVWVTARQWVLHHHRNGRGG